MSITVLMAVYNGSRYLKASIKSILNQTFQDFELIIINDCSTDDSLEIMRSFDDDRITVHSNTENLGQTESLNKGLNLAQGKYIARIDADDLAFPKWLEQQHAFIQKHSEYRVVSTRAAVIDGHNRIIKILKTPLTSDNIILRCLTASPINHVGSLMHTQTILDYGGYDERFTVPADYDLWSRLIRRGYKLGCTNDVSIAIRFHEHSLSKKERGERDISEMSEIMFENIRNLTTYAIRKEDIKVYWRLNYHVEQLDEIQFQKAVGILRNVYQSLKPSLGIKRQIVDDTSKKQIQTIYMKRIFAHIRNRDVKGVRNISRNYAQAYGLWTIFSWIWIASYLGMITLQFFPLIYEKSLRMWTKIILRKQIYPGCIY